MREKFIIRDKSRGQEHNWPIESCHFRQDILRHCFRSAPVIGTSLDSNGKRHEFKEKKSPYIEKLEASPMCLLKIATPLISLDHFYPFCAIMLLSVVRCVVGPHISGWPLIRHQIWPLPCPTFAPARKRRQPTMAHARRGTGRRWTRLQLLFCILLAAVV